MNARRTCLRVEQLGERTLPSATVAVAAPLPTVALQQTAHALTGSGRGEFLQAAPAPGSSEGYRLRGMARVAGLGDVRITGSVHTVGNTREGTAVGTLTLTNARGSVTVELVGPRQAGFSALPTYYRYRIVKGSGEFAQIADAGTVRLDFSPTPRVGVGGGRGAFSLAI